MVRMKEGHFSKKNAQEIQKVLKNTPIAFWVAAKEGSLTKTKKKDILGQYLPAVFLIRILICTDPSISGFSDPDPL
jgi:hypothetical protein